MNRLPGPMLRRALLTAMFAVPWAAAETGPGPHFARDRAFDMRHIRLELSVDLPARRVESSATLTMTPITPQTAVTLDAVDFELRRVAMIGPEGAPQDRAYAYDGERLTVYLPGAAAPGQPLTLQIDYVVEDPSDGLHFFGPDGEDGEDSDVPLQVWSQGQPISNRYWAPCFDHPNEMQTSEIIATVDAEYEVLSNGRLIAQQVGVDGKAIYHWLQDQPHVSYLITLVVGDFEIEREEWRGVPLLYYVPPDRLADCEPTFRNTARMMDFFSDALGVQYPWAKYAQVTCYNYGGGMENTSATTIGENSLVSAHDRLDSDSDNLLAHELAHQWFGDLLTCTDWTHIWLNEGFATYFEALWTEHDQGPDEFAHEMLDNAAGAIHGGRDQPIVYRDYATPDDQFDSRAYPKGAWVLHMLRRRLGDELFWKAMNVYVTEFRHRTVQTADLRRTIERVAGRSFDRFFYDWTERPGHPIVELTCEWNASDRVAEVLVRQTQEAEPFVFPLVLELHPPASAPSAAHDGRNQPGANGSPPAPQRLQPVVLRREMRSKEERFLIPLPWRPERLAVDPHQEVLMELTEHKPREMWLAQLRDDPSPVGRLRAVEQVAEIDNEQTRAALAGALETEPFWAVRSAIARKLGELGGPAARTALLSALPRSDPRSKAAVVEALGEFSDDPQVKQAVADLLSRSDEAYGVTAAAISAYAAFESEDLMTRVEPLLAGDSRRDRLRSAALAALGASANPDALDVLVDWADPARTPLQRRAAISALAELVNAVELDEAQRARAVEVIVAGLESDSRYVRMRAISALGDLGEHAVSALDTLRDALADERRERVREQLSGAIAKIEAAAPKRAHGPGTENDLETDGALREELRRLAQENAELRERLTQVEAAWNGVQALLRQLSESATGPTGAAADAGASSNAPRATSGAAATSGANGAGG